MSRTIHCRVDVRGAIQRLSRSRGKWAPGMVHGDGRPMTRYEAIDGLMDVLAAGHDYLPIGEPCEGWDPQTGCPGHPKVSP